MFVQKPVSAREDVAGYSALRKWSEQFCEVPEGRPLTRSLVEQGWPGTGQISPVTPPRSLPRSGKMRSWTLRASSAPELKIW